MYLERIILEFKRNGRSDLAEKIQKLWNEKLRVPKEALSLDTMLTKGVGK
jgi:hypothetical protein